VRKISDLYGEGIYDAFVKPEDDLKSNAPRHLRIIELPKLRQLVIDNIKELQANLPTQFIEKDPEMIKLAEERFGIVTKEFVVGTFKQWEDVPKTRAKIDVLIEMFEIKPEELK
jgi:hypothetical protein